MNKLKNQPKDLGIFANLEIIGSYHDFSQVVSVDYLNQEQFMNLLQEFRSNSSPNYEKAKSILKSNYKQLTKFYSTCAHEFTHWLDHTSTLWGQKQLLLIYNAINAWTNQNEYDFDKIVLANSERQKARLATYYTEKNNIVNERESCEPWEYSYGTGLEFGVDGRPRIDRPFIFTVFSNSLGQRVLRVPFSVLSLTESNATYAEYKVKMQGLSLLEGDSLLVEMGHLKSEIMSHLYNSELVVYTVAAHHLANSIGLDDVLISYEFSSALATFCLNLPRNVFDALILPDEPDLVEGRLQALKDQGDTGFAFYSIAKQAPMYQGGVSVEEWLQAAIENSGLPDCETIMSLVLSEMQELENKILEGIYSEKLRSLMAIGRDNFIKRGIWGQHVLSIENIHKNSIVLPPIVLGDGFTTPVSQNSIPTSQQEMDQWIEEIIQIEVYIDNFIRACRY